MADNSKTLAKLTIYSFEDNTFKGKSLEFITPINPETFTKTSHIELDKIQTHGKPSNDIKYNSTAPEELKIEFTLDGTKTMEGYFKKYFEMEVSDQLAEFTKCVYQYKGETHRPRFLIIIWGSEVRFSCVLSHMDVSYSLFKPNGNPLRVKVSATFIKYQAPEDAIKEYRLSSTDLTHYKISKQGDRLDILTNKIYSDPNLLLQLARANNMGNIKKIKAGIDLFFPPINKNEA